MLRKFQARLILCESDDERKDIVESVDVVFAYAHVSNVLK